MMRIIDCIRIQKYPPTLDDACLDSSISKSGGEGAPVPWLHAKEGGGGMERSPWFSTRTSHASPGDGDGTFKPYYTVDDGAWDRHAATFSNAIRMRDIGICAVRTGK